MHKDFVSKYLQNHCSYESYRKILTSMNISFVKLGEEECEKCFQHDVHKKECHRMLSIKSELRDKMDLVIIPGGITRLIQPLDVSVNKPIKDALRAKWNNWLSDGSHTFTPRGRIRQPTLVDVAEWVLATWKLESVVENISFAKFQQDNVGKACQRTKLVTAVGRHLYSKRHRKPSKYPDIRKSCMRDMRRLGAMVWLLQNTPLRMHANLLCLISKMTKHHFD